MKLKIVNPSLPVDLDKSGGTDQFQQILQAKCPDMWVGFSYDFGTDTLEIDTSEDVSLDVFSDIGEGEIIQGDQTEEYEDYILESMGV